MPRSSTISRIQRLEIITARLKSEQPTTIGEIAKEVGVSVRTLSRDIEVLREQGLPIDTEIGRGGGAFAWTGAGAWAASISIIQKRLIYW